MNLNPTVEYCVNPKNWPCPQLSTLLCPGESMQIWAESEWNAGGMVGTSGKRQITYSCLILLICLNFENKEEKPNKQDFLLTLYLNFIQQSTN